MTVPDWVQDAIFYQIFPDRFANAEPQNNPPNIQPWGAKPAVRQFQGGNLRGIIQHFDYLIDLGINAIYLNPIFQSPANHRYHTTDYYRIDPLLGTMDDFRALLQTAHKNNVRIILDGVFNHSSRGFYAFNHILENGEHSPYRYWYHIHRFPLQAFSPGKARNFEAWWDIKDLPKFNTDNPLVRRYLFDVARFWTEQGIDGWRLDVPSEIDDPSFWAEFYHTVKSVNPQAYLTGELWELAPDWVGDARFDGLMNYPLRTALLDLLTQRFSLDHFARQINALVAAYPRPHLHAMYLPLGSHDTERLITLLKGNLAKTKFAFAFQFAFPGAPAIYYGDEIGLQGGKDPDNRRAFPWETTAWNHELRTWLQHLISLRKQFPALRRGEFQPVFASQEHACYAFSRRHDDQHLLAVFNASGAPRQLRVPTTNFPWPDGQILQNHLSPEDLSVSQQHVHLTLPPWGAAWITKP
ncbi:MAG: alpha-amylase family glycosyl hydrolase [Anaerolineae bacterium]|nr:alpha-amylase family glycosyl hydrolase [Anaerolineae bacterium]